MQTCISLLFLGITFILYHYRWMKSSPDDTLISCVRLIMGLLLCDLLTFLCDFIMVLKRNWFFISLRYITSSVSFTLGVMIQIDFGLTTYNGGDVSLNFKSSIQAWIFGIMVYIYQCYIVWGVINILMYNQIVEEDARRKKEGQK